MCTSPWPWTPSPPAPSGPDPTLMCTSQSPERGPTAQLNSTAPMFPAPLVSRRSASTTDPSASSGVEIIGRGESAWSKPAAWSLSTMRDRPSPTRVVSLLSRSVSLMRKTPKGMNTTFALAIALCRHSVSSVIQSPLQPCSRTLTKLGASSKVSRGRNGVRVRVSGRCSRPLVASNRPESNARPKKKARPGGNDFSCSAGLRSKCVAPVCVTRSK